MRQPLAEKGAAEPISISASLAAGKKVPADITNLLTEDHRTVLGWFRWYSQVDADSTTKVVLVERICRALRAHMAIEEDYFYPALERGDAAGPLVAQARAEHDAAKAIMTELEAPQGLPDDELVAGLEAEISAHVAEEEAELFPAAREAGIDVYEIGRVAAARRVKELFARRMGGLTKREDEEIPTMHISQSDARDFFVLGLKNAHAVLRQGRVLVETQAKRLEQYPALEEKLQTHLAEKDAQLERLEMLLSTYGESPSVLKDTAMAVAAGAAGLMSAAAADEIVKNSFATLAQAKYEAAALETLIVMGEAAGEHAALRPLQQSLNESRGLASFIEENLRPTAIRFLQLRTEGKQASH